MGVRHNSYKAFWWICNLVTIIDHVFQEILAWQVSNTMDAQFCVSVLESHGIRISMDGVNRALDNIFVERFWRSLSTEIFISKTIEP